MDLLGAPDMNFSAAVLMIVCGQGLTAKAIFNKCESAVVTIQTTKGLGTGFVVGDNSTIITCFHVVKDDPDHVWLIGSKKTTARLVGYDVNLDVAVLRANSPFKSHLKFGQTSLPNAGTKIFVIGTPLGVFDKTMSEGIVSSKRKVGDRALVQITAAISHGSSGSPVLSETGEILGMAMGSMESGQSLNFAVGNYNIKGVLERARANHFQSLSIHHVSPVVIRSDPPKEQVDVPSTVRTVKSLRGGLDLVVIPDGQFTSGADREKYTFPAVETYLASYTIGKNLVTVSEFRAYCEASDYQFDWDKFRPYWGWQDDHPMVNVTSDEARAFCRWSGGDLPTEAQWEKAARGRDGRKYPWGNTWDASRCQCSHKFSGDAKSTASVGSFPSGASPYGVLDMAGNVLQLCIDSVNGLLDRSRGGSWVVVNPEEFRSFVRFSADRSTSLGFRCVGPSSLTSAGLSVKASPLGSTIEVNGQVVSPWSTFETGSSGKRVLKVTVRKDGFENYSFDVLLTGGETVEVPVYLKPNKPQPNAVGIAEKLKEVRAKLDLISIPAGEFTMGSDSGDDDEKPVRQVYLDAYKISKNLVTVAQFRLYCEVTGYKFDWDKDKPDWGWKDDHPMVGVTWEEARAFCRWAGGDLPTEAQWEKAARGTDSRGYPWGNTWDESKCQNNASMTCPVGSFPQGASSYGVLDMAGNVWEWCSDWYQDSYSGISDRNPSGPASGERRVLRGGCWCNSTPDFFRSAHRGDVVPVSRDTFDGFRFAGPASL